MSNRKTQVPCGKCPDCYKNRISEWSYRLMQEKKGSFTSYFITLTYDTDHVHITRAGYMGLNKRDAQLFMKRLRKLNSLPLTYYLVGEYGDQSQRPHYHALLFNVDIKTVSKAWGLGQVHYGHVTEASTGYCLKYMHKTCKIPLHRNDDRIPNFALMSKGIGKRYINKTLVEYHKTDVTNRCFCSLPDGKKIKMPRYYKEKIYGPKERKAIAAAAQRKADEEAEIFYKQPIEQQHAAENGKAATTKIKFLRHQELNTKNTNYEKEMG